MQICHVGLVLGFRVSRIMVHATTLGTDGIRGVVWTRVTASLLHWILRLKSEVDMSANVSLDSQRIEFYCTV